MCLFPLNIESLQHLVFYFCPEHFIMAVNIFPKYNFTWLEFSWIDVDNLFNYTNFSPNFLQLQTNLR